MKVFLSHSTQDKTFVEALAEALRTANIEPWLCEIDILPGDDFVAEIEKGLQEADLTLLIWSPEAARSAWTGQEWRSVLAREIEESRTHLGLILLREAEIPELLRTKHRLDARADPEKAVEQIVKWLIRQRDMRIFAERTATRFIIDYEPTDFVGRTSYLEQLHTALVAGKGKFLLWGEPGSGKSMLALQFAWRAQGAFDAVVLQHCGQRPVEEIAVELAERIGLKVKELPSDQQLLKAKQWICKRRTLLILDDIWDRDIQALIPRPPLSVSALSVLCTSRQRTLPWIKRPRTLEVKSFTTDEAESLFRIWLGEETVSRYRESLQQFAERVEQLPIAVAVAAEMLSRQFGPLDETARALALERLRNEIHNIPGLLQRAIETQAKHEQQLLQAMAICHPDGFWLPLAGHIANLDGTQSGQARDQLIQGSLMRLIDRERQHFRLHGLLRKQLLRSTPTEILQNRHAEALEALFANWEHRWKECRECLPEVIPAIHFLWKQGSVSRMQQLAHWGVATGYRIGGLEAALRITQEEELFSRRLKGRDAKDGLQRSYGHQALILQAWGQLKEALALHKKKETLCEELGNKKDLASSYNNQAGILKTWGRLEEALALLKKQEALCKELGNKKGLAASYSNQAGILQAWGRLEEALALHKREEALCEELGNKDGLQVSYGNQALILQAWGRLEEALALHKREEALCEELGNKEGLSISYGNQALILQDWGKLEEALALLKKQEALCETPGLKRDIGYCYWNWGLLARSQQDQQTEHKKLQAALEIFTTLNMPRERDAVQAELEKTQKATSP